jgi:putative ABC transport system permease protein
MTGLAYIAWRYVVFHKMRSFVLIGILALCTFLPTTLNLLMRAAELQMTARAEDTALVVGAKGSDLDLVMNALYFHRATSDTVPYAEADKLDASGLGYAIPIYAKFKARGFAIVGTSLDYFDYRKLKLAQGRWFGVLGEAVVGAKAAKTLGVQVGSSVLSTPEALFDIAGVYPLKMQVVGVLEARGTADDNSIFVDVRTTWVIEGLGHGHQDLLDLADDTVILKREAGKIIANAKLMTYAEITPENVEAFHFHGAESKFPLSAILFAPAHTRGETILRGRYEGADLLVQAVKPSTVIKGLMGEIFQIKKLLDGILVMVGAAVCLALFLIFTLSAQLRKQEMEVNRRIGASRFFGISLVAAEIAILTVLGGGIGLLATAAIATRAAELTQQFIVN